MKVSKKKPLFYSKNSFYKIKLLFIKYRKLRFKDYCFYDRHSIVLYHLLNTYILVFNGLGWIRIYVKKWMVGKKLGMFTWNRKYFKKKK